MSDYLTVTLRPDGVDLTPNVGHYKCLLKDLFALLAENGELWEDLVDLISGEIPPQDRHLPAKSAPEDLLADRIVESLRPESLALWLQRGAATRLRDNLAIAAVSARPEAGAA